MPLASVKPDSSSVSHTGASALRAAEASAPSRTVAATATAYCCIMDCLLGPSAWCCGLAGSSEPVLCTQYLFPVRWAVRAIVAGFPGPGRILRIVRNDPAHQPGAGAGQAIRLP